MAQPPDYVQAFDFGDFATSNPTSPLPGASVDTELVNIATSINAINDNIALIQRDDGELKNLSVGIEQLDASVAALIAATGGTARGAWVTATAYVVKDLVVQSNIAYICVTAHTAGTFSTDLAAGKWMSLTPEFTSFIATLLDDATAAAARTTLVLDTKPNVLTSTGVLSADELNTLTTDATIGAHTDLMPFVDASEANASNKGLVSSFLTNSITNATDTTPAVQTDYEVLIRKLSDGSLHKSLLSELGYLPAASFLTGTSLAYDPANLSDNTSATTTVTVTGAALGDFVGFISSSIDLQGITIDGEVSAANTVTVLLHNDTGGALNLGAMDLRAVVIPKSRFGF